MYVCMYVSAQPMARPFNAHSTHVGTFLNVFVSRRSRDCSKFQLTKHPRTERPTSLSLLHFLHPAWKQMRISTFCKLGEQRAMHVCNFLSKHFVCFELFRKKRRTGEERKKQVSSRKKLWQVENLRQLQNPHQRSKTPLPFWFYFRLSSCCWHT